PTREPFLRWIEWRYIINIRMRSLFRKQPQRHLIFHYQFMNRRFRIIEDSNKTDTSGALCGTGIDLPFLQPGIAENAFFTFPGNFIEVNLLVWTGTDAVTVSLAARLINQHNTVLFALVNRLAR